MAYSINKTDGSILTTVADGQIDTLSTDLTLIGKNYSGFGEALNENFVKLLENFSASSQPSQPIRGQIWFDTTESKLKVYNGLGFVPVSSATISSTQPLNLGVGDLWFNDVDKQLYFYDGVTTILLGPSYSVSQAISGFKVDSILDSLNQNRVVTYLYNNGILLGIFSKDTFTPKTPIVGFAGDIITGFTAGSLAGLKFKVTVTNSESLGNQPASSYVRNDTSNIIDGQLILSSNLGVIIGDANQGQFQVQNGNLIIANIASNKDVSLIVRKDVLPETALRIDTEDRKFNIYEGITESETIVGGDLTVVGNLRVQGELTTLETSTLIVEDKNIELAKTENPTDELADGGGMILKGTNTSVELADSSIDGTTLIVGVTSGDILEGMKLTGTGIEAGTYIVSNISGEGDGSTWLVNLDQDIGPITITATKQDHTFIWSNAGDSWNSSEHIDLAAGRTIKINGVTVLSDKECLVPSFPNVNQFGAQLSLTVDDIFINDNIIECTAENTDIEIILDGTGTLNLGNKKITDLATPADPQDATNKDYVDTYVRSRDFALTMDISDGITDTGIAILLESIAPAVNYELGTKCRILCTFNINSTTTFDINPLFSFTPLQVLTPSGTAFVPTNIAFANPTIAGPGISISRVVKIFEVNVSTGQWSIFEE